MVGNVGGLNNRLDVMMDYNINNAGNVNAVPHAGNGNGAPSVGQQIKAAFENFGNKVAEKFAAFKQKVGEGIDNIKTAYREWSTERSRLQTCKTLDRQDDKAPRKTGDKQNGAIFANGDRPHVSSTLSKLMKEIDKAVSDNKDPLVSEKTLKANILKEIVVHTPALTLENIDVDSLKDMSQAFRLEGRKEKAALLDDVIALVEYARTPIGAEEHFLDLAKAEMKPETSGVGTFLRQTSGEGTSAVRKLMVAAGGHDYAEALTNKLTQLDKSEEANTLRELMKNENVSNTTHPMSRELAEALTAFSLKVTYEVFSVKIPDEMKECLGELTHEIRKDRTDGNENTLTQRLYADQLILKCVGPAGAKLSPVMKIAVDIITKVGSQAKATSKMQEEMGVSFKVTAPRINEEMQNFLVENGMSLSAKAGHW